MTPRRWALLALALVGAGTALVWQDVSPPSAAPPDAGVDARAKVLVDTAEHCEAIRTSYVTALAPFQRCERDEECVAERREGVLSGLEGCARYHRVDAGLDAVEAIASSWLGHGCAHAFMTCAPRRARCVQHTCVELPPPGVPPTWRRYEHRSMIAPGSGFSMFLPPEYGQVNREGDDGEGGRFTGATHELDYELDEYAPFVEAKTAEGEVSVTKEESLVNGRPAVFQVVRTTKAKVFSGVHFALDLLDARRPTGLSIFASCETVEECADVATIGHSVEIEY